MVPPPGAETNTVWRRTNQFRCASLDFHLVFQEDCRYDFCKDDRASLKMAKEDDNREVKFPVTGVLTASLPAISRMDRAEIVK